MSDEESFLATIRAAPNDDATRLVYADWLEERSDVRAEFLRLQQTLAGVLDRLQHLRCGLDSDWVKTVEIRRDVVLHCIAPGRVPHVTKLIRMHTAYGLAQARAMFAQLPATLFRDQPLEQAERIRQDFAAFATVTIEPTSGRAQNG